MSFAREVEVAARLARSAGQLILAQREGGDLEIGTKARDEVVTSADRAADQIVHGRLATLLDGTEIRYNRTELRQPMGMVAAGPALHAELLVAFAAGPTPIRQ
jgi:3'-phosphoadenosine 5'-phosphosulfate (PAPS) 3'-phosphatase